MQVTAQLAAFLLGEIGSVQGGEEVGDMVVFADQGAAGNFGGVGGED